MGYVFIQKYGFLLKINKFYFFKIKTTIVSTCTDIKYV